MFRAERLDDEFGFLGLVGQSTRRAFLVALRREPGSFVRLGWIEDHTNKELARFVVGPGDVQLGVRLVQAGEQL